jgi:hypothetical protein
MVRCRYCKTLKRKIDRVPGDCVTEGRVGNDYKGTQR